MTIREGNAGCVASAILSLLLFFASPPPLPSTPRLACG